jgi:hypothetical protein
MNFEDWRDLRGASSDFQLYRRRAAEMLVRDGVLLRQPASRIEGLLGTTESQRWKGAWDLAYQLPPSLVGGDDGGWLLIRISDEGRVLDATIADADGV